MRALFSSFKIGFIACASLGLSLSPLLAEEEIPVRLELSVGDDSGSHSERYNMIIKDKETGSTLLVHQAPSFGKVETTVYNQFRTGKEYEISLAHTGTDPGYLQNNDNKPDYDYFAEIKEPDDAQTCNQGRKPILIIKDEQKILGDHGESDYFYAQGKTATLIIALLDLDIEHPGTGEVTEEKEGQEGLVAVKRDEETPLTRLKLKPIEPSNIGGKYYLTFPGDLKIWKSANRTGAVTEETEFNPDVETTLYVEALEKSDALNDQEITLNWRDDEGENDSAGDWVNLTAVQAEFPVELKVFLPPQWVSIPFSFWPPAWPDLGQMPSEPVQEIPMEMWPLWENVKIARGDDRFSFSDLFGAPARVRHKVVICPYKELSTQAIKLNTEDKKTDGSKNYRRVQSIQHPNQAYSDLNRLIDNAVLTDEADPDLKNVYAELKNWSDKSLFVNMHGVADEPIVNPSAAIDWDLTVELNTTNPLEPKVKLTGKQDGFPGYELYIKNLEDDAIPVYQWLPPGDRTIISLLPWLDTEDVSTDFISIP